METIEPEATLTEKRGSSSSTPQSDPDERLHALFEWSVAGLAIAALWLRPIASSLRVDELGTWWVIQGSAREVVQRAQAVQGQSPLYYLMAWGARHLIGVGEIAFRLPSLIIMLAAAALVFLIAQRLFDRETARLAVVVFVIWPSVAFTASDARPYALATLAVVASVWALIVWLDSARLWNLACYVILAAGVAYAHPIFGLVFIPEAGYALARMREGSTRLRLRDLIVAATAVLVLVIPVAVEVLNLWRRQGDWSIPSAVSISWIVQMLVPAAIVGTLVIGGLIVAPRANLGTHAHRLRGSTAVLLVGWYLIPTALLVGLALASSVVLLAARYLLCAAPAGAILSAVVIRSLEPSLMRRIMILVLVVVSVLDLASPFKEGDIRGAAELVRSVASDSSVVFLAVGFEESLQPSWYVDPKRQGLLTAATSYYAVPGKVEPLPITLDPTTIDFVRSRVGDSIAGKGDVVVVVETASSYAPWFNEFMLERGWQEHDVGNVDLFTVTEFTHG
jgi:mannosyltransferase